MTTDNQNLCKAPRLGERENDLNGRIARTLSRLTVRLGLALAASGVFALACAADLEGDPSDYTNAYAPPGGSTAAQAGATGLPGGGGNTAQGGNGTAGSTSKPPPEDPPCLNDVLQGQNCFLCHVQSANLDATGGGLLLTGSNLGMRLSGAPAQYKGVSDAAACTPGALLIDPANPAESVLLKKVKGTQSCGLAMPFHPSGITDATALKCIEDWVMSF